LVEEGGTIRLGDEILFVESFQKNEILIESTGTGGGFALFCSDTPEERTDINDASRPINDSELEQCRNNGIEPVEFRVGTDALAIVVNPNNQFVDNLTIEELRLIFGEAETWSDVRATWPNQPILRAIPGADSGTLDYFAEEVFDGDTETPLALAEITSEDDAQLVRNIQQNEYAIGFFGFAYYLDNQSSLRSIPIEGVTPQGAEVRIDDLRYTWGSPSGEGMWGVTARFDARDRLVGPVVRYSARGSAEDGRQALYDVLLGRLPGRAQGFARAASCASDDGPARVAMAY